MIDKFNETFEERKARLKSDPNSEILSEIMQELDNGKIDTDKLLEKAQKVQQARIKKRKSKEKKSDPTIKEIKKKEEEEFEESIKLKTPRWTQERILNEFETYPDLKDVYFNVAENQPTMNLMIRKSLGFEDEFRKQIGRQLKKLRRMGLIDEVLLCESWWKNYFNKKFKLKMSISSEEKIMIKKLPIREETDERTKNMLVGNSGFWILTELGKNILSQISKPLKR